MCDNLSSFPTSFCSHLKSNHIQLLLAAQGLSVQGSRKELVCRLESELRKDTLGKWIWQKLPDLPEARFACTVVEWGQGLYVYGGFGENVLAYDTMLMWRPGLSTWESVASNGECAPALYHHTAVVIDHEMWIFGSVSTGRIGERRPCIAAFDFIQHKWRVVKASGPTPICLKEGKSFEAYVCDSSVVVASQDGLFAFDVVTKEWKAIHRSPGVTPFWSNYRAALEGRDLYLFGWSDATFVNDYGDKALSQDLRMYRFNLDTCVWSKVCYGGTPPKSRDRFCAVKVGDKWVVHGGTNSMVHSKSSDETFVYNFSTRVWGKLMHTRYHPQMRAHFGCAKMGQDQVVFVGGRLDWNGRNRALSTPCHTVECLKLVSENAFGEGDFKSLIVMSDTNRSIVVSPIRRKLYMNKHLSDVVLVVDGKEIMAHTIVLAEGSTFFERMWSSGMVESETKRVEVSGVSYAVMKIVLQYLYGCMEEIPIDLALEVFKAADLYEVPGLRSECLKLMMTDMELENLVDFWHLANQVSVDELTDACVELAVDNLDGLCKSPSFVSYKSSYPELAVELVASATARLGHEYYKSTFVDVKNHGKVGRPELACSQKFNSQAS